jgi:hypothetical protein
MCEQVVEHDVAGRVGWRLAGQHHRAGDAHLVGRRRRHAHVVALPAAAGDQRVAALGDGVGAQVLELAGLVAAAGQPRAVVALHPQAARLEPQGRAQTMHRLERRRQVRQRDLGVDHGGRRYFLTR